MLPWMETDSAVAWSTSLGMFTAASMIAYSFLIAPSSIPLSVYELPAGMLPAELARLYADAIPTTGLPEVRTPLGIGLRF